MHRDWSSYFRIGLARAGKGTDVDVIKRASKFADAAAREHERRDGRFDESDPPNVLSLIEALFKTASDKLSREELRARLLADVESNADKWIDLATERARIDRFELGIPF
jgi:hypothetical protein